MSEAASHESLESFLERLASSAPTPGGGAVAALAGALGAALAHMVASLTVGKKKFADVEPAFREAMPPVKASIDRFRTLMDDDARAFDAVMAAMKLPKSTPEEEAVRAKEMERATLIASEVPMATLELLATLLPAIRLAAEKGNPHAVSDAGMAALLVACGARAAAMNVKINLRLLSPEKRAPLEQRLEKTLGPTTAEAESLAEMVDRKL